MALDEPIPNTMAVMEPNTKKKYKTKKEKKKDAIVKELMVIVQTMVGDEHHDEKTQSLKDLVEEVMKRCWTPLQGSRPKPNMCGCGYT
jgi:hypothetical protein